MSEEWLDQRVRVTIGCDRAVVLGLLTMLEEGGRSTAVQSNDVAPMNVAEAVIEKYLAADPVVREKNDGLGGLIAVDSRNADELLDVTVEEVEMTDIPVEEDASDE